MIINRCSKKLCKRLFSSSSTNRTIGFIGLGNMGKQMSINLCKKDENVIVYDLNQEAINELIEHGASSASSPKEVASHSDIIITMLPSSPHVKDVYLTNENSITKGLVLNHNEQITLIDCSTIDPATAKTVAKEITAINPDKISMVDAPVSGGVGGARDATLTFMVGGNNQEYNNVSNILNKMGQNIVHCGVDIGTGQVAKICNNLLLAISMIGTSEAMNIGIKSGMKANVLNDIINSSSGKCWSSEIYNPVPNILDNVPSSNQYQGGFGVDLMKKDINLAIQAAETCNAPIILGSIAR